MGKKQDPVLGLDEADQKHFNAKCINWQEGTKQNMYIFGGGNNM